MGITREEVLRVARLAHIDLTDEEAAALPAQLDRIISYVHSLDAVPAAGAVERSALSPTPPRADEPSPSLSTQDVLGGAPGARGALFGVPRVIGGEDESA
ncbi:MAG: Asp-tRNA(Asn)/Glu-tRNA(Gln) amidotransferase subunit GatC [bacterium]